MNFLIILAGKLISYFSKFANLGNGSTWPGHIALKLNPNFIKDVLKTSKTKVIIIAGTNGKTTTGRLVTSIIRENNNSFLQNKAGANLLNGLASTLVRGSSLSFKLSQDYLIFECDENALPKVILQTNPDYVICLNLFRDQLDRYGEIDSIAKKWHASFENLTSSTTLILNADDPQMAYLARGTKAKAAFFGLDEKGSRETAHGADSIYCPRCSKKLAFDAAFFSHLGLWSCPACGLKRPKPDIKALDGYPLEGTYNRYNALASSLFAKLQGFKKETVDKAFSSFTPAFGRGEKLNYKGKKIQIFLSKNPTSFNESIQTIKGLNGKNLLVLLNDQIPDGLDVSWIWDINFENILDKSFNIAISGDRVYDMGLRLKYAQNFTHIEPGTEKALDFMIENLDKDETLYILPNYSAMLNIRKLITGKKIL